MKKNIIKVIVLALVFVIGVYVLSSYREDKTVTETTITMSEAKLPIVILNTFDNMVNPLHGYVSDMEACYMRDTITPLDDTRELKLIIDKYTSVVTGIKYEVRSLDTSRLVEETQVTDYVDDNNKIHATLNIKNLLEKGKEYILKITLSLDDGSNVNYYTRIIGTKDYDLYVGEKLNFVKEFNEKTFDKELAEDLVIYLESNHLGDNSTFNKVNINSKFEQVTWGNLNVEVKSDVIPQIKEINSDTASITFDYVVSCKNEDVQEYYNISEYYRVRYTSERMYLLDFKREMNEIFSEPNQVIKENRVTLGIGDSDVEYEESTDGRFVSFVWQNALWALNPEENKVTSVFTFRDDIADMRVNYNQNAIKILDVEDEGNIDFIVYGYMPRGTNEGKCGVSLYRYERELNTIEEKVFIPSTKSYQYMSKYVETLAYLNDRNTLYIMIDDSVYSIDVETTACTEIVTGIEDKNYVVSEDGQFLAWQNESGTANATKIFFMDLEYAHKETIEVEDDTRVCAIGFIDEDFIYGKISVGDIMTDDTGKEWYPMYSVIIMDKDGNVLEDYQKSGTYVVGANIDTNMIRLKCVRAVEGGYVYVDDEYIMNNAEVVEKKNKLVQISTELKETQMQLNLYNSFSTDKKVTLIEPKEIASVTNHTLEVKNKKDQKDRYYVFAEGKLQEIYDEVNEAIICANDLMGVVVSETQEYVWERGSRQVRTQVSGITDILESSENSLAACLDAILLKEGTNVSASVMLEKGETALTLLDSYVEGEVFDLTGTPMSAVLYYVSKGAPVIALNDEGYYVLIVGYDELNITVMNPVRGTTHKIGMNDSTEMFENAGNIFIGYLK